MAVLPPIPTNFLVQQGDSQVLLTWDLMSGASTYTVQESTDNITYVTIATPSVNSYQDDKTVGTTYFYKINSVDSSLNESSYTNAQSVCVTANGEMSLGQIRTLAQQTADMQNSQFVTVPEWNMYINQSYFELYDILVQKYGNEYFVQTPYQFSTTGTQFYDLPSDFYKLLGVDISLNASQNAWLTLKRFNFISRNRYIYPNLTASFLGIVNMRYRIMGNQLEFIPNPQAGQTIQVWYVPKMTQLLADSDILDGISGWTEYVIVDAAIKALMKEESDTTALMVRKQALLERIEAAAENRDAGEPDTISDTRRYGDVYGWGANGDGPYGGN